MCCSPRAPPSTPCARVRVRVQVIGYVLESKGGDIGATVTALSGMTPAAAASPSAAAPAAGGDGVVTGVLLPAGTPQDRPRSQHRRGHEDTTGDAEFARLLAEQFDAEDAAGGGGGGAAVPAPAPAPAPAYGGGDYESDFRARAAAAADGVVVPGAGGGSGDGVLSPGRQWVGRQGPPAYAVPAPAPAPRREPAPAPAPAPPVAPAAGGGGGGGDPMADWPGCATERACRYEYDTAAEKWERSAATITVVVHDKQFGEGGLRNVRRLRKSHFL